MPPKAHQNSKNLAHQEGRILLAISAIKNRENPLTIRKAARLYDVPFTTLQNRLRGTIAQIERRPSGHKLTITEEETLLQWILSRDRRGMPPRPAAVQDMANENY